MRSVGKVNIDFRSEPSSLVKTIAKVHSFDKGPGQQFEAARDLLLLDRTSAYWLTDLHLLTAIPRSINQL